MARNIHEILCNPPAIEEVKVCVARISVEPQKRQARCIFTMNSDEITEVGVYGWPHAFASDTTLTLSDVESESDSEVQRTPDTSAPVEGDQKMPHPANEDDSEDSDTPEVIWEAGFQGRRSPRHTLHHPARHPPWTLLPTPNGSCQAQNNHCATPRQDCSKVKFLSWNIDGLNDKHLAARTIALCDLIQSLQADVVFLQEVVPHMEHTLRQRFRGHRVISANDDGYYTVMLLNRETVHYVSHKVLSFSSTKMDRNVMCTEVTISGCPLLLMNTHLESMAYSSEVRKAQLRKCFRHCKGQAPEKSIIFGGDLNLRDREVEDIGGLQQGIVDIWELCGRALNTCYTWDMSRNDNLDWRPGAPKPRFRFDRIYFRPSVPPHLKPSSFVLVGQERLQLQGCFPSDHWGILCEFAVM